MAKLRNLIIYSAKNHKSNPHMESEDLKVHFLFSGIVLLLILQSCASTGNSMNDEGTKVYNKNFNSMVETVEAAIRSSRLSIETSRRSQDPDILTIIVSERAQIQGQSVQRRQGEVRISKLGENKTKVDVTNPDYHYSVPEDSRTDYERMILNRIDSIMKKNS